MVYNDSPSTSGPPPKWQLEHLKNPSLIGHFVISPIINLSNPHLPAPTDLSDVISSTSSSLTTSSPVPVSAPSRVSPPSSTSRDSDKKSPKKEEHQKTRKRTKKESDKFNEDLPVKRALRPRAWQMKLANSSQDSPDLGAVPMPCDANSFRKLQNRVKELETLKQSFLVDYDKIQGYNDRINEQMQAKDREIKELKAKSESRSEDVEEKDHFRGRKRLGTGRRANKQLKATKTQLEAIKKELEEKKMEIQRLQAQITELESAQPEETVQKLKEELEKSNEELKEEIVKRVQERVSWQMRTERMQELIHRLTDEKKKASERQKQAERRAANAERARELVLKQLCEANPHIRKP